MVADLVQRDDRHASLQVPLLQQQLTRLLVVHDHLKQLPARTHLHRRRVPRVAHLDQLAHHSLHARPVESLARVRVRETHVPPQLALQLLQPTLLLAQLPFYRLE